MNLTPTCDCGWTGKTQPEAWRARANLRQHQDSRSCTLPADAKLATTDPSRTRAARVAHELNRAASIPQDCTVLDGHCTCQCCARARTDHGSPLDIGGRWVAVRGVRRWIPTPQTSPRRPAA